MFGNILDWKLEISHPWFEQHGSMLSPTAEFQLKKEWPATRPTMTLKKSSKEYVMMTSMAR